MIDSALERFVEFMDSGALGYAPAIVVGLMILVFLLIVVHELGHAVVALACTESLVHVRVGRSPGIIRGRVGRLAYSFDPRWVITPKTPG